MREIERFLEEALFMCALLESDRMNLDSGDI